MAEDYYATLGVSKTASQDEIQRAYRELAKKHHPDRNPDDKTAKDKFKAVQNAYDVLNDPKKREMYDRFGSHYEQFGGGAAPGGGAYSTGGGFEGVDLNDLFSGEGGPFADIFRQFGGGAGAGPGGPRRRRGPTPGNDIETEMHIPFTLSVGGGETTIRLQKGDSPSTITVKVPAGIEEGKKIRLRGQGMPGANGGPSGDILITVHVDPHPFFERRGNNLHVRVPVSLGEAAGGAEIDLPTPRGTVSLKIPRGTSSGAKLRVKGYGVPSARGNGDLLAEVQIVLPKDLDENAVRTLREFDQAHPVSPRRDIRW